MHPRAIHYRPQKALSIPARCMSYECRRALRPPAVAFPSFRLERRAGIFGYFFHRCSSASFSLLLLWRTWRTCHDDRTPDRTGSRILICGLRDSVKITTGQYFSAKIDGKTSRIGWSTKIPFGLSQLFFIGRNVSNRVARCTRTFRSSARHARMPIYWFTDDGTRVGY